MAKYLDTKSQENREIQLIGDVIEIITTTVTVERIQTSGPKEAEEITLLLREQANIVDEISQREEAIQQLRIQNIELESKLDELVSFSSLLDNINPDC